MVLTLCSHMLMIFLISRDSEKSHLQHLWGNVLTYALSHFSAGSITSPSTIDLTSIAQDQPALSTLGLTSDKWSCCKFKYLLLRSFEGHILCYTSTGSLRSLVLDNHQCSAFHALHSLLYPGTATMMNLVMAWFIWPNIRQMIAAWTRFCLMCQRAKVYQHVQLL